MSVRERLRKVLGVLGYDAYQKRRHAREFFRPGSKWPRWHGLYSSRREAEAVAHANAPMVGYDHPEAVNISIDLMSKIWASDYPMIFWLSRLVHSHSGLFDLGGHVGTKYRAYRSYLDLPESFRWIVCDLPHIVDAGRRLSSELPNLQFTTDRKAANGSSVLIASGALQYADFDLGDMLDELDSPPQHLLLNKVPTHDGPDIYTLENLHHTVVPYRIFNRQDFQKAIESRGYALVDKWMIHEHSVRVPLSSLGKPVHMGFYLKSTGTGS